MYYKGDLGFRSFVSPYMDIPPFSRSAFASDTDWKERTMAALECVDMLTTNKDVRAAARALKRLLELESNQTYVEVDEHIPADIDPDLLLDCLRGILRAKDGVARLKPSRMIMVELAVTSTKHQATLEAVDIIKTGFKIAEFIVSGKPFRDFSLSNDGQI